MSTTSQHVKNQLYTHLLTLIQEEGSFVFASPQTADFFRKQFIKQPVPSPAPLPKIETKTPPLQKAPSPPPIKPSPVEPIAPVTPLPIKDIAPLNLAPLKNLLSVIAPELAVIDTIPNDAHAQKIAERWKTKNQSAPISILSFQEPLNQRTLLEQIALSIDCYFGPTKIVQAETIEKENQWDTFLSVADLKMIIVCDYTLWQLHNLMNFYKEVPAQGIRVLKTTPLFLLPDLSLYLKDPLLKRSLWKALCQKFS